MKSKKNEMSSVAMYTEWPFPYWGRGKGSYIGVVVRAWVSQLTDQVQALHAKNKKIKRIKLTYCGEETCQTCHTMYTFACHLIILLYV